MLRFENISVRMRFANTPVLFLHAFPVNQKMWLPQMEFLRSKKVDYLSFDYPGFGESPPVKTDFAIGAYSEIAFRILKEAGVEKAIVAGLSMGGYVALSLFRDHPEIFAGILLANTRASADSEEGRQRRRDMVENLRKTKDLNPVIGLHLTKFFTDGTRGSNPDLVDQARNMMQESTIDGINAAQLAMASRPDSRQLLKKMDFPAIVVHGSKDTLIQKADAESVAEKLPDGRLEIIRDAAHLSNLEQPERFNDALWKLVTQLRQ